MKTAALLLLSVALAACGQFGPLRLPDPPEPAAPPAKPAEQKAEPSTPEPSGAPANIPKP